MNKFLNFSTILFSYVLITVLVSSCSCGCDSVGTAAPDKCLLANRADKDSLVAVLCYQGVEVDTVEIKSRRTQGKKVSFVIPSTNYLGSTNIANTRTWDLSQPREIKISHSKDYTPELVNTAYGSIEMIDDSDDYRLQRLTINSFLPAQAGNIRLIIIKFTPKPANLPTLLVAIIPKLAVKDHSDFISMAIFTASGVGDPLSYVLVNDLNLVAPGGEGAKFEDAVIPVAEKAFHFDGGGKTITLESEIDTLATGNPAAIIGRINAPVTLENFTLNIDRHILGYNLVGTLLAHNANKNDIHFRINDVNININRDIIIYQKNDNTGYIGGVAANSCVLPNNVVIKTEDNVAIKIYIKYGSSPIFYAGGVVGSDECATFSPSITKNVVDVKIAVVSDSASSDFSGHEVYIGGFARRVYNVPEVNNNLVKLAISRSNLPDSFVFRGVAGFVAYAERLKEVSNNLVYADFSNLGKVDSVGGLLYEGKNLAASNNIANNMIFIADGFEGSSVNTRFGAAIALADQDGDVATVINIVKNFVSSPVTDYDTNYKLASFVHTAHVDINFDNLILDDTTVESMFPLGSKAAPLRVKVTSAEVSTLAEGADSPVAAKLKEVNSQNWWEEGSQNYPQLKNPPIYTDSFTKTDIETYWESTNADIQTGLAARAAKNQEVK